MDPDTSKGLLCQDASAWKAKPFRGNLAGSFFKRGSVTPRSAWHNAWVCHSFSSWGFGFMSKTFFFLYDPQWCCCRRMSGMLMGAPQELIYLRWPCWPPWGGCEGAQAMASGTLEVLVWRLLAAGLSLCYFVNSGRASWEGLIRRGWANRLFWKQLLGQPWWARGGAAGGGLSCLGGWCPVPKGFSLWLWKGEMRKILHVKNGFMVFQRRQRCAEVVRWSCMVMGFLILQLVFLWVCLSVVYLICF